MAGMSGRLQARIEGKRSYRRSRSILPDANGHGVPRTNQTEGGGLQSLVLSIRIFRGPVSSQPGNVAFLDRGVIDQRPGAIPRAKAAA
jgi:hypothetical protein